MTEESHIRLSPYRYPGEDGFCDDWILELWIISAHCNQHCVSIHFACHLRCLLDNEGRLTFSLSCNLHAIRGSQYPFLPSRELKIVKLTPIVDGAVYRRCGISVVLDDELTFHCCLLVENESLLLASTSSTHGRVRLRDDEFVLLRSNQSSINLAGGKSAAPSAGSFPRGSVLWFQYFHNSFVPC